MPLLYVMDDHNMDHIALMSMLELLAAFDPLSHDILLQHLLVTFGLLGTALNRFHFYLNDCTQSVNVV